MKTAIHRRLDKFCSQRVQTGRTDGVAFKLASWLEALLRQGKSTWRYGVKQESTIEVRFVRWVEKQDLHKEIGEP